MILTDEQVYYIQFEMWTIVLYQTIVDKYIVVIFIEDQTTHATIRKNRIDTYRSKDKRQI